MLSTMTLSGNQRIHSYKYRQASDFWYLTGFEEPNSAVILGAVSIVVLSARQLIWHQYRKNKFV